MSATFSCLRKEVVIIFQQKAGRKITFFINKILIGLNKEKIESRQNFTNASLYAHIKIIYKLSSVRALIILNQFFVDNI